MNGGEGAKIKGAQAIFRGCEAQATRPALRALVDAGSGPDVPRSPDVEGAESADDGSSLKATNFATEQGLLTLHVWIKQRHLLGYGERGLEYQDELFATLWDNTTHRECALSAPTRQQHCAAESRAPALPRQRPALPGAALLSSKARLSPAASLVPRCSVSRPPIALLRATL